MNNSLGLDKHLISKTNYLSGLQCSKLVWHVFNASDALPIPGSEQQLIFEQGRQVGVLARQLYSESILIAPQLNRLDAVIQTNQALVARRPIFEAAFEVNEAYARVDILDPAEDDRWDLIEVKSTTSLQDIHLDDIAFQAHVLEGSGIRVRKYFLMHVNNTYIRHGPVDPARLFTTIDVTDEVQQRLGAVSARIVRMRDTINLPASPDVRIGAHCDAPYMCPLHDRCWSSQPKDSVLSLYRGRAKGFDLIADGVATLAEITDDVELTENQSIQRHAALTGQPQIDAQAIAKFLATLEYSLFFLDFESIATAIPLFDNTRPYEQIVFQYSLHVCRHEKAALEHHVFLANDRLDPRPDFIAQLKNVLGDHGSVIVFNAAFEIGRLRECCALMPEYTEWVESVVTRMVDLLGPFRSFIYYNSAQEGSASMKAVLPALTGQSYGHLAIRDGTTASREFLRVMWGDVSVEERERVRNALLDYCALDTGGMVSILGALRSVAEQERIARSTAGASSDGVVPSHVRHS